MRIFQGPTAAALCLSLLLPPLAGAGEAKSQKGTPLPPPPQVKGEERTGEGHRGKRLPQHELAGDRRILHALNRFTFGPRPGDVEAVKAMGLDRWFDQQLHPAALENAALDQRLAEYPAMQASSRDLLYRFPSNAVIRQVIDGKAPMPEAGPLNAIYSNQVARVAAKRQEKQGKDGPAQQSGSAPGPAMEAMTTAESMQKAKPDATDDDDAVPVRVDPGLVASLQALAPAERIARLASLPQPELDALLKSLKGPHRAAFTADMTPEQKETVLAMENPERLVTGELMAERLTRDIYSNAQVQEVMTDFWLNHFNVFLHKNPATPYYLVSYERDTIRPHALGKFEDLLEAVAHSPAMLLYLDNAQSTGPDSQAADRAKIVAERNPDRKKKRNEGLNENYARELMELHTLGVNGGYTQQDVIQAARVLTGWTVEKPQRGGAFTFDERRHEPGTKKVLGKKFKENGEQEGRDLLHLLATRPATAQFICLKLAVRFVRDDPPQSLVDRMAKTFLASNGDIAAVLKTMFKAPEFWQEDVYRAKVKTPLEYVVSAARASGADVIKFQQLVTALRTMGMPLFGCVPPTGYKWDAADWVSTGALVNRMNFALSLAANRLNGVRVTWAEDATETVDPEESEARLEGLLVEGGVSLSTRTAVLQQFEQQSAGAVPVGLERPRRPSDVSTVERQDQVLAGLLLGSPEFQRR